MPASTDVPFFVLIGGLRLGVNLLADVQAILRHRDCPPVARIAKESGIPYDTVLSIRKGERDSGYNKVKQLADYLIATAGSARA